MEKREYINVVADYLPDGAVRPVSIRFAEGPAFAISRIISETHMSTTSKDGAETRYRVKIGEREHYLFLEDIKLSRTPRWFVLDNS